MARVYDVLAGTQRVEQPGVEQGGVDRIVSDQLTEGWMPLLSRVNGTVLRSKLAEITKPVDNVSVDHVYLRTDVELAGDGQVTFSADAADLWVDGAHVDGETILSTELSAEKHTVLVRLDAKKLPASFRLVSRDVTFATE